MTDLDFHVLLQHPLHHSPIFRCAKPLPQEQVPILGQLLVPHRPTLRPLEEVTGGYEAMLASKDIADLQDNSAISDAAFCFFSKVDFSKAF